MEYTFDSHEKNHKNRIVYSKFEDKGFHLNNPPIKRGTTDLNRSLTPIVGCKIQEKKSNKVKLNIKMPSVRMEKNQQPKILQGSFQIRNISITPSSLLEKSSIKNYSPPGLPSESGFKSKNLSKNRLKILPDLKSPDCVYRTDHINRENIYSELLGFLIRVQVEYLPIYQKIDIQRKGKIEYEDFENFIYKHHQNIDPQECFSRITQLNSVFSNELSISKRNFLALCTGLRYNKSTAKDVKAIFLDQNFEVLKDSLLKLLKLFREFTEGKFVDVDKILKYKNFNDEKMQKALNIVFSENVDFQRFISCLPFFHWMKNQ